MKKILAKIQKWWLFTFRNPVEYEFEFGGFHVVFKRFWMQIESVSDNFKVRFLASQHPYGYLYISAKQGNTENIQGYCHYLYKLAYCLTSDNKLVGDINKALTNYDKRIAAKAATAVSTKEDDLDLETVKQNHETSTMSKKQRNQRKKQIKDALKDEQERNSTDA